MPHPECHPKNPLLAPFNVLRNAVTETPSGEPIDWDDEIVQLIVFTAMSTAVRAQTTLTMAVLDEIDELNPKAARAISKLNNMLVLACAEANPALDRRKFKELVALTAAANDKINNEENEDAAS